MKNEEEQMKYIAEKVLQDQILLRKLCDRIYELMNEEVRNQQERKSSYRGYN
ncbi:MAG: hypothetical protein KME64_12185 [Scytonematopsis contorta HA4267-MV1]|jgi:hypothetical protein|nr:hypothetical protein [Scytonematopsis contorta HA4267-MV1]